MSSSATTATTASNKINNCNNFNSTQATGSNTNNTNLNYTTTTSNSHETCLICGDVASGKHYGLRSCEACKAFFKRTVQGKIEYSCPATRECEINKRRRKACQACRFQKCLNMGMLKEGVRLDRVRGGRQKYRRGLSPNISNGGNSSNIANDSGLGLGDVGGRGEGGGIAGGSLLGDRSGVSRANSSMPLAGGCPNLATAESNRIMTALINCEPEELTASLPQSITNIPSNIPVQMRTLYILSDLFDRELVSLIGWAKQIPGFSETITLNDQMRLLQSTWAEVIALSIGYRSHLERIENFSQNQHENSEMRLVFAKDLIIDFKHAVACGAEEIFYNCVQLIKRLDQLRITPKEYILLKATSLTNADVRLEDPTATHRLRDLVMETLYEVTLYDCSMGSDNHSASSSSPISNVSCNKDGFSNNQISMTNNHVKVEAQDRSLCLMNQFASASPPRPSSSVPSSSSLSSSISPHNNNNNNSNNNSNTDNNNNNNISSGSNINNIDLVNKRILINNRLNQVLLCLPVLRQIDSCIRKFWNDVRKGPNNVPMNKLFEEMLEPCQRIYRSSAEM